MRQAPQKTPTRIPKPSDLAANCVIVSYFSPSSACLSFCLWFMAVFQGGLSWERSLDDWHWAFGVNVFGIIHGIQSFVPRMIAQGTEGHVVNTASVAAFVAGATSGPYVVSKCAAFSLTESLALDLAAVGSRIGASVLTPSSFDTGIAGTTVTLTSTSATTTSTPASAPWSSSPTAGSW